MSSVRFQRVKPGDLITAELINAILTEVESLQDQIDGLSGALIRYGATVILHITATYVEPGTYQFALAVDNPGALWTVTQPSQPVRTPAGPGTDSVDFMLKLSAAGPSSEKRVATVTATRQDAAGAGRSSVISFPIIGFS